MRPAICSVLVCSGLLASAVWHPDACLGLQEAHQTEALVGMQHSAAERGVAAFKDCILAQPCALQAHADWLLMIAQLETSTCSQPVGIRATAPLCKQLTLQSTAESCDVEVSSAWQTLPIPNVGDSQRRGVDVLSVAKHGFCCKEQCSSVCKPKQHLLRLQGSLPVQWLFCSLDGDSGDRQLHNSAPG